MSIESRKSDHIKITLERDVSYRKSTWLEYVELVHQAASDFDPEEVDTTVMLFGREFNAPIVIESMTGGTELAYKINANLAEAAVEFGVPMGVGSQRAGIEKPETTRTFRVARERAPDGFLIGNIGAAQLVEKGVEYAVEAVEMIEANAIAIHLNALQEIVQPDGRARFKGFFTKIVELKDAVKVPVILKEIGCGLSKEVVAKADGYGVDAFDVAGSGGTNWTLIEMIRAEEGGALGKHELAEVFLEWGIPTAATVLEAVSATKKPVIASGGVRTGLDIAKCLALGAYAAGLARPFLKPATESKEMVLERLGQLTAELKTAMYLVSCRTVNDLRKAPKVLIGPLHEWFKQRIIHV